MATSENTQYIYFTYTLWGAIVGCEVAQLQKLFFSENPLVYMLFIWHSGRIMKPTWKWYFWPFLCLKIAFFCHFCPNLPTKCQFLNGRHNFFCICRLARLKINIRGLLLYFQKNKKFLKLVNFTVLQCPTKKCKNTLFLTFLTLLPKARFFENEVAQLQNFFIF